MKDAVLAVDPATNSGWSVWSLDGAFLSSGESNFAGCDTLLEAYVGIKQLVPPMSVLVMEEPWGRHFRSLRKQAEYLATWECACGAGRVVRVNPSTWQSAILGLSPRANRAARKRAAQKIASKIRGCEVGEDEADAICIGLWAVKHLDDPPRPKAKRRRRAKR